MIRIHLHSRQGIFTVVSFTASTITVKTKNIEPFNVPVKDFNRLAGGTNNYGVSDDMLHLFKLTVTGNLRVKTYRDKLTIKNYEVYTRSVIDNLFLSDHKQVIQPHLPLRGKTLRLHINCI